MFLDMASMLSVLGTPDVRRLFGKRELVIIKKQLWGVMLTQSEKNRLSRDIRKKLDVVEKLARFSSEFRLKKGAALKERIAAVLAAIRKHELFPKVRRIWLFGSSAQKERTLRSDVDIAVEFEGVTHEQGWKFRIRIAGQFDEELDIKDYDFLPEHIKAEVRKGRILYERKDGRKGRGD